MNLSPSDLLRALEVHEKELSESHGAAEIPFTGDVAGELRAVLSKYATLSELVEAIPDESLYWVAELARRILATRDVATRTVTAEDLDLEHGSIIEGPVIVEGDLDIETHVMVLGSLTVKGRLSVGETGALAVAGDVSAACVSGDGWIHVPGTVKARVILGYYEDGAFQANSVDTELMIHYNHGVSVNHIRGPSFRFDGQPKEDHPEYQKLIKLVVDDVLADDPSEVDLGVGRVDFRLIARRAVEGQSVLRKA